MGGWFLDAPGTVATFESCFRRHVLPVLGDRRLGDIDKFSIDMLVQELARNYSKSIVHKARTHRKAALEEAVEQDPIAKNQAHKLVMPATRKPGGRFLSTGGLDALIVQLRAPSADTDYCGGVSRHLHEKLEASFADPLPLY